MMDEDLAMYRGCRRDLTIIKHSLTLTPLVWRQVELHLAAL